MKWYLEGFKNYAVFKGRASLLEYWAFVGSNIVIVCILIGLSTVFGSGLVSIYLLAIIIPMISITIRRLHDTGREGVWCLIMLVPIVGQLILLIFCCEEGVEGVNSFEENFDFQARQNQQWQSVTVNDNQSVSDWKKPKATKGDKARIVMIVLMGIVVVGLLAFVVGSWFMGKLSESNRLPYTIDGENYGLRENDYSEDRLDEIKETIKQRIEEKYDIIVNVQENEAVENETVEKYLGTAKTYTVSVVEGETEVKKFLAIIVFDNTGEEVIFFEDLGNRTVAYFANETGIKVDVNKGLIYYNQEGTPEEFTKKIEEVFHLMKTSKFHEVQKDTTIPVAYYIWYDDEVYTEDLYFDLSNIFHEQVVIDEIKEAFKL